MICRRCGQDKVAAEFYWNSTGQLSYGQICKFCRNGSVNRKVRRNNILKLRYGISAEEYQSLLEKQEGKCVLCKEIATLQVDHDHKTGKVRGLLCQKCNVAIGFLKEDLDRLYRVIDYLNLHGIKVEEEK